MIRKILLTISLILISFISTISPALALGEECASSDYCSPGEICKKTGDPSGSGRCVQAIDALLPDINKDIDEVEAVEALPDVTYQNVIATAIKTILGWSMLFTLAALIAAGFYYLTSRGKEESISKAKTIIVYLVLGIAIMAAAYAIIIGISQFDIFKT